ncbi:hypothetical protein BDP27DRAFT_1451312 [Rhodocollybia butyracea]|uniref:Uncharacterized protein n=1 Tax=Rhodocollybia butyracea TaxID=206335 RepID=A0A9P5PG83_9AGAR|nr:hypothetical protein BDP27DRAFT_1451312 [Rhodocollybia butyracea]
MNHLPGALQNISKRILGPRLIPQNVAHIAALPALPPRSEVRPTPWLSPSEMETYLLPIQGLVPWQYRPRNVLLGSGNGLRLQGGYRFRDELGAIQFMEQVELIAKEEQSDLHGLVMDKVEAQRDEEKDVYLVRMKTITKNAFMPKSVSDLRSEFLPAKNIVPFPEDLIIPGVTIRDMRLTLLIDRLFRDHFLPTSSSTQFSKTGLISIIYPPEAIPQATISSAMQWLDVLPGEEGASAGSLYKIRSKLNRGDGPKSV